MMSKDKWYKDYKTERNINEGVYIMNIQRYMCLFGSVLLLAVYIYIYQDRAFYVSFWLYMS